MRPAWHNDTAGDPATHASDMTYHDEHQMRHGDPTEIPAPGAGNFMRVPITECVKCGQICSSDEDYCICGGYTFNYSKSVLLSEIA